MGSQHCGTDFIEKDMVDEAAAGNCRGRKEEGQRSTNPSAEGYDHGVLPRSNSNQDLTELSLPNTMKTFFPHVDDILNFVLTVEPDEGMYKGGSFKFSFTINSSYPHDPPKVKCQQKIYHPNIDLDGNVCLNILREDWKPVLNLNSVMIGLQFLFLEPNASDPLNKGADRLACD